MQRVWRAYHDHDHGHGGHDDHGESELHDPRGLPPRDGGEVLKNIINQTNPSHISPYPDTLW